MGFISFSGSLIPYGMEPPLAQTPLCRSLCHRLPFQAKNGQCHPQATPSGIPVAGVEEKTRKTPASPLAPERSRSAPRGQRRSRLLPFALRLCRCRHPRQPRTPSPPRQTRTDTLILPAARRGPGSDVRACVACARGAGGGAARGRAGVRAGCD